MKNIPTIWMGFLNAAGVVVYTAVVVALLFNAEGFFSGKNSFLVPLLALLLFVISAAITGLLVLGRPAMLYLDGQKKEALSLLFATLAWLVLFAIGIAVALSLWG